MQHLRDGEEVAVRANLTIKYAFILRSDLPEIRDACAVGCGEGTAKTVADDALKIVARGADKEDQAALYWVIAALA
jgi:hypothetical protein